MFDPVAVQPTASNPPAGFGPDEKAVQAADRAAAEQEAGPSVTDEPVPSESALPARRMARAKLLGRHRHRARDGTRVLVYERAGRYLARGNWRRRRFGETLPKGRAAAETRLAEILAEIGSGSYVRPSDARKRPFRHGPPPRINLRQLINEVLVVVRARSGKQTAADYRSRLVPALEYAESPEIRSRWPWAIDLDGNGEFALGLRSYLHGRVVTGNGHPAAEPRRMSAGHIVNVLGAVATALNTAKSPEMNLLPITFDNPFNKRVVGKRPRRDPLAPPKLPTDVRADLVRGMDRWQLCTLAWSMVLPQRPDEIAGLLVTDVLRDRRELVFETRWGGDDCNKASQSFRVCYPPEFDSIIAELAGARASGPLLRRRTVVDGRRRTRTTAVTADDVQAQFNAMLARAKRGEVQNPQDRKRMFRRLLVNLGGVDEDDLAGEFKKLLRRVRPDLAARFYDSRGSVITDLKKAGVEDILRRYITGRSLAGDVMAAYEAQDLHADMAKYFNHIRPLLDAVRARCAELRIGAGDNRGSAA